MKKEIVRIVALFICLIGNLSVAQAIEYCPEGGGKCTTIETKTESESVTTSTTTSDTSAVWWGSYESSIAGVNAGMLQVGGGDNSANSSTNVTFRDNFLKNIQVYMLGLLGIVSVSVFLYIGFMLFTAQGKEDEFKKAWTALIYAVIGLAVIPLAYIAVKIVTGFTF